MNMLDVPCVTAALTSPQVKSINLDPINRLLRVAQQRLLDETLPKSFKMMSYIRLCCSAIRIAQQLGLDTEVPLNSKTPYLSLLSVLATYKREWWHECSVNPGGDLVCGDRIIQELLQPLNRFVAQHLGQ